MADDDKTKWPRVTPEELRSFVERSLTSVGMMQEFADDLADLLLAADYRGHYSHGLNRLDTYIDEMETGWTEKSGEGPTILKETAATAWVDGNNIPGPTVGKFCMELAIKKAKDAGVSWVTVKNSNHYGIAGFYSMMAAKKGLLGLCHCNTSPVMAPTRAKERTLGTNPIAFAAPGPDGDDFVLDMATSTVALGKVELAQRKDTPIPSGWGCDKDGKASNDSSVVLNDGALLPLGGMEATGGYKGYGLNLMVEFFCSVLSGSTITPFVRKLYDRKADLGQCFIAVNPEAFAPGFTDRSGVLMDTMRNLEPVEGEESVQVAGDPERTHMKLCDELGGIPYHPNQIQFARDVATRLGIAEMKTISELDNFFEKNPSI